MRHTFTRLAALALALAALGGAFGFVVRPWYLTWGATNDERTRALPGDDVVGANASQETRAITINAGIDYVWPWVAQTGQDRGGFYSFDLLENLVGCQMPTVDRLDVHYQTWNGA